MNPTLLSLHPLLRQAAGAGGHRALPTGHAVLDAALHEGGWPLGALTELLSQLPGMGELSLLAPALAQALARPGWLVLVTPPGLPHAPAWQAAGLPPARVLVVKPPTPRDWLWAVDQAARAGQPAVLAWPGRVALADKSLRRLQLAAEEGGGLLVLARRQSAAAEPSPAALRLSLQGAGPALRLQVLKQRGSWGGQPFALPLPLPAAAPPSPADWLRTVAPAPVAPVRPVAVARAG
jgi:cell division inhibitor SulA/protein ImuA